eukprot:GHVT01075202.1.p1 GENE.GHVT01075202.1~~GHVT01075202.1.p1  ORF type:complete len:113 (+),score=23.66 GHVT01075202.1:143-481(+)
MSVRTLCAPLGAARAGGAQRNADLVEYDLKLSFRWLRGDQETDEHHRLAAVLILEQLAVNAPILFRSCIDEFFEAIWVTQYTPQRCATQAQLDWWYRLKATTHNLAKVVFSI